MRKKYVDFNDEILARYLKDIKKSVNLNESQEIALAKRISKGDTVAVKELVSHNLKFVIMIAKEYNHKGCNINDLISSGNEGLITAAMKYDPSKGFRFLTYAVWWIRESMIRNLKNENRTVRIPINIANSLNTIRNAIEKFENENGYEPVNGDIDGIKVSDIVYEKVASSLNISSDDESDDYIEMLTTDPDDEIDYLDEQSRFDKMKLSVNSLLTTLPNRERDIISLYYGINNYNDKLTLESIGNKYNLTKERIRQIKSRTLRKLRYGIREYNDIIIFNSKDY